MGIGVLRYRSRRSVTYSSGYTRCAYPCLRNDTGSRRLGGLTGCCRRGRWPFHPSSNSGSRFTSRPRYHRYCCLRCRNSGSRCRGSSNFCYSNRWPRRPTSTTGPGCDFTHTDVHTLHTTGVSRVGTLSGAPETTLVLALVSRDVPCHREDGPESDPLHPP